MNAPNEWNTSISLLVTLYLVARSGRTLTIFPKHVDVSDLRVCACQGKLGALIALPPALCKGAPLRALADAPFSTVAVGIQRFVTPQKGSLRHG